MCVGNLSTIPFTIELNLSLISLLLSPFVGFSVVDLKSSGSSGSSGSPLRLGSIVYFSKIPSL